VVFGFDPAKVAGTYIDPSTAEIRAVEATDGVFHLRVGRPPGPPKELVPVGPGDLLLKGTPIHYVYKPAKGTRGAQFLRLLATELPRTLVRTDSVDKAEGLTDYAGRFGSDELAHDLEIRVEDGQLVAGPVGGAPRRTPFTPVARDLFGAEDVGLRFERDARGKVVRLIASTDRAQGVVLVRR
jgi:hypothetical protein